MKRAVLFSFLNLCLTISLIAQDPVKKQSQPQENSKVTREYDEKGNLIKFDSVYSYSWLGDSTIVNQFSPEDISKMFGGRFNLLTDNTFSNHSFFDDFDKMFASPFGNFDGKQDSIFMKHFNQIHQFNNNDSLKFSFGNLGEIFDHFFENEKDSTALKNNGKIAQRAQPKSMDEMMQMFQQQFKEMEKHQQQFFEHNPKQKEF